MATHEEQAKYVLINSHKVDGISGIDVGVNALAHAVLAVLDEMRRPRRKVVEWFTSDDEAEDIAYCDDGTSWTWNKVYGKWEPGIPAPIPQPESP